MDIPVENENYGVRSDTTEHLEKATRTDLIIARIAVAPGPMSATALSNSA